MPDSFVLDANADDQKLLAQVVSYYTATLKTTPEAQDYLRGRGITNTDVIDRFRVGYADRTLGLKLPAKQVKAGAVIRERLHRLGLFRQSGHEHLRGSITFPIPAADGSGRIADIYGRKVRDDLRAGTPAHTHLNDSNAGVWNVEAFAAGDEIVLCSGLWDGLTFWSHGYRHTTCMFGHDAITDDMLAAFEEFGIRRVLTPCRAVVDKLLDAGLEVFVFQPPHGLDVNAFARQTGDPADALGGLLRGAAWEGKGIPIPSTTPPAPAPQIDKPAGAAGEVVDADDDEDADEMLAELLEAEQDDGEPAVEPTPVVRTASPVPPPPAEIDAQVGDDEVVLTLGNRRYRVRGMAKNQTLDVLRVNVLAGNDQGMHIDTFDLYSARHRKAFQEAAATEFQVEEAVVKRDLGRVLLKIEEVQDARQQAVQKPKDVLPEMTAADRDAALALLRDPNLLDRVADAVAVVGERTNKLAGYLACVSRKLDTPLAVIVQSTSAAGKTTLMEAVLALVPAEDVVKFSAMTGQSLYYMGGDSLKHKVLAIVEEEGAARAGYALKLLQSEGELRIASTGKESTSGRMFTQEYRVEGPTSLFLTTTSITVDEELLNRCLVLTVDEDRDQTRAIHRLQRQRQTLEGMVAAQDREQTVALHRNAQRLLRPVLVVNPFAERLTFADTQTRTRRDHAKYLTLIRAVAFLHQHQRPTRTAQVQGRAVEFIEVTVEDIERANELAHEVLGRSLDELPPQTHRLLCSLDAMVTAGCRDKGLDRADYRFSRREARAHTGWGDTQLKIHLRRLAELEYLVVHRDREDKRFLYELLPLPQTGMGGKVLAGLIDVAELRLDRSGQKEDRSDHGRGPVGLESGHGRAAEADANSCETSPKPSLNCKVANHEPGA